MHEFHRYPTKQTQRMTKHASLIVRLAWFAAIWVASAVGIALAVYALRGLIRRVGQRWHSRGTAFRNEPGQLTELCLKRREAVKSGL